MPEPADSPWTDAHPRDALKSHGLWAKKSLGQNFLVSPQDLDRIVEAAQVGADEAVLEIGTGLGRLTARLAARARRVVTVEIDAGLHALAAANLRGLDNVVALHADFLESKHRINPAVTDAARAAAQDCGGVLQVVSNLPYGISSPATVDLLEWDPAPSRMCLTVQQEVADRMAAPPGTAQYGLLTVFMDYWAAVEKLFPLGRRAFWPVPDVDSTVVRIVRRPESRRTEGYDRFAEVARKLFTHRRKTLRRALALAWDGRTADEMLAALGMDPAMRVEQLGVADLEAIAAAAPGSPRD